MARVRRTGQRSATSSQCYDCVRCNERNAQIDMVCVDLYVARDHRRDLDNIFFKIRALVRERPYGKARTAVSLMQRIDAATIA